MTLVPLHLAAHSGNAKAVEQLIVSGADGKAVAKGGWSALHYACSGNGDPEIIQLLIRRGLDANAMDDLNSTPLHQAALSGNVKAVEQLIASGADGDAVAKNGWNALHFACSGNGDPETVKLLIRMGLDVNARNNMTLIPLHLAAYSGNAKAAEQLIVSGADREAVAKGGWSALHYACCGNGDPETIQLLTRRGLDANGGDDLISTPLHRAAFFGNAKAIELLIASGADGGAVAKNGWNALHYACSGSCDPKTIRLLIRRGLDTNARNDMTLVPLHLAAYSGKAKAVEQLIASGADGEAVAKNGWNALHYACSGSCDPETIKLLIRRGLDANARNDMTLIPLHQAARSGNAKAVEQLIASGADAKAVAKNGCNALHYACSGNGDPETIQLLIRSGLDANARDDLNSTPLHRAAFSGNANAVDQLIALGADGEAVAKNGWNALRYAFSGNEDPETIKLLIRRGPDANARNDMTLIPLHHAAYSGDTKAVEQLIASGVDADAVAKNGWNALHYACSCNGDPETIKLLIRRGVDVSARDDENSTPVHRAALSGNTKAVEHLIASGADAEALDKDGWNALHYACSGNGDPEVIKLLIRKGVNPNRRDKFLNTPLRLAKRSSKSEAARILKAHGASLTGKCTLL